MYSPFNCKINEPFLHQNTLDPSDIIHAILVSLIRELMRFGINLFNSSYCELSNKSNNSDNSGL